MKTRTFKILVAALILLQLGTITTVALSVLHGANDEQAELLKLMLDVHNFNVTIGDYELAVAAQETIDRGRFDAVRGEIDKDLSTLQKTNAKRPERLEILERQGKLMDLTAQVVELLKDTVNQRDHADRFAILITMLKGTRKLDKISHKMHDDLETLVDTMPRGQQGPSPLLIAAIALSAVSTAVAAVLLAKGSSAMSY